MKVNNIFIINSSYLISARDQVYLQEQGNVIHQIHTCQELARVLKQTRPDVLIIELVSLIPDVMDLLEELDKNSELQAVPRLAVLNRGRREYVLLLARMGIQEIFLKPVDINSLSSMIEQMTNDVHEGDFIVSETINRDGFQIVEFLNHIDVTNSVKLDNFIDHILLKQKVKKIAFDMRRVEYLDSAGLGMLVICRKKIDAIEGEFKLLNVNEQISNLIHMLKLESLLEIKAVSATVV